MRGRRKKKKKKRGNQHPRIIKKENARREKQGKRGCKGGKAPCLKSVDHPGKHPIWHWDHKLRRDE